MSALPLARAIEETYDAVRDRSTRVEPSRWQSIDVSKKPEATTFEVLNHTLQSPATQYDEAGVSIAGLGLQRLRTDVKPNLPWADDHFEERVRGLPLNPGIQWAKWPWGNSANSFRSVKVPAGFHNPSEEVDSHGRATGFHHSYMERMWPKMANQAQRTNEFGDPLDGVVGGGERRGIRYNYGDAMDVVRHLAAHPDSRQAYLPIWFPEDTGKTDVRVPCTLGYHFIHRHGYLHCTYYIRSCDLYRHFRDDVYLTVRLQLWVLDQLRAIDEKWGEVRAGLFTMHVVSLHCFVNDARELWPSKS